MLRILLVEDNQAILESIEFELQMRGFDVTTASDGMQAWDILTKAKTLPDIIVSDIAMPRMDGYQLLEKVHENEMWNAIPFIFLTALGSPNAIRTGKELYVDDYIVKPFRADDLVVAINNKVQRVAAFRKGAERQLNYIRSEVLSTISHELRTPLTAVYGGTAMLEDHLSSLPDETLHQMLGLVKAGAARMKRLIEEIMYMIQLDSGEIAHWLKTRSQACDIGVAVTSSLEYLQLEAPQLLNRIDLVTQLPHDSLAMNSSNEYLRVAVSEVIRNACLFSEPGREVAIKLQPAGKNALLVVEDGGCGIPAGDIERVWQRFVQINRSQREQQGIGLGLSLTREIVVLHGGHCWIESVEGQGTRVTLQLPLVQAA